MFYVGEERVELSRLAALGPKPSVYAISPLAQYKSDSYILNTKY